MNASHLTCADAQSSLGALVLGAIDPQERDHVEAHVRSCPSCSALLTELAPLPGLLHRVDLSADELGPPPQDVLERALASVRPVGEQTPAGPRRRWIPVAAGLAAAVLAVAVGIGAFSALRAGEGSGATVTASGSSTTTSVSATVAMTPRESGTELALTLSGVTPGEHCSLVAVSRDGKKEIASSWVATYDGDATVTGSTWLTLADIERLDITTESGDTLLRIAVPT